MKLIGAMIAMGIFLLIVTIVCRVLQVRQEKNEGLERERRMPDELKAEE